MFEKILVLILRIGNGDQPGRQWRGFENSGDYNLGIRLNNRHFMVVH
jgi:uncharacterized protein (DUF2461 family)